MEETWSVATLRIDLRSGFDRDAAEIWIGPDLRWCESALTTKFTLDLAASVPLEVADGPVDIRIVLPGQAIEQSLETRVAGETHVVARLENDKLVVERLAAAPDAA
jgi:hypothetical protein